MGVTDSKPVDAGQREVLSAVEGQEEGREKDKGRRGRVDGVRRGKEKGEEDPWKRAERGAPSENFRPEAWTPGVVGRRGG